MASRERGSGGWGQEGRDVLRGLAAGSIVGVPLLYTMEMWHLGFVAGPLRLLLILGAALLINFLFCLLSGFHEGSYGFRGALSDSLQAVALGLAWSAGILWLIGRLPSGAMLDVLVGQIVLPALPVSIGVSFANRQFVQRGRGGRERTGAGEHDGEDPQRRQLIADLRNIAFTLVGATVFSLNTAPTEEIFLIAAELSPLRQLLLLAAEGLLCYVVLYASGLRKPRIYVEGSPFQSPWAETAMATAHSLLVALVLVLLIGYGDPTADLAVLTGMTVTLGLPAVVGGAAGRVIT